MHEMSLMESVLDIIEDSAASEGFSRVRRVRLEIGALSGVEPHALSFCFDAVMRNTLADGAGLEIVLTPGTAWCAACGKTVGISERIDPCPECGRFGLEVTGGTAMRVGTLDVE